MQSSGPQVHKTTCPLDGPGTCGVLVTVEEGCVARLQGDPAHPLTRGFHCHRVATYQRRVYSPLRLARPMRRIGKKGQGRFAPITWDEALNEIAARNIASGNWVRASNGHGECPVVTADVRAGLVVAEGIAWPKQMSGGRGINALVSSRLTDLGGGSTFQCNLVEITRAGD